jgi:hypothetical protein
VRPWDLPELLPGGQRILFRGVDDEWRLVRFADDDHVSIRPETTRRVELRGWGPDSVPAALGIAKPDDVELEVVSEDLGHGETETLYRYQWTEGGGRSILAEEIKNEIYDGATPYSTYVRGVIVEGDRGMLLTGRDDSALIIEG